MNTFFKKYLCILSCLLLFAAPAYGTSRAVQINFLLSGLIDPTSLEPVAAGTVYFYEAGTSTAKNVWTEKEKTNPYTSYTLSSAGVAQLYGEGEYKIVVKDSNDATLYTWDNVRLKYPNTYIRSISSLSHFQVSQDDWLLVDTSGGHVTINCLAAASWDDGSLKVMRTAGSGTIVIDPSGSETINGSSTYTIDDDQAHEIISDGSQLLLGNDRSILGDADGDTKIQTEESADEDKVRIDVGGTQVGLLSGTATETLLHFNSHQDADGDTKIQVEESADEDTIRFDVGGSQVGYIDSDGIHIGGESTFADNSNGNPTISDTTFDAAANITDDGGWESVGPTGSGADNIWTGLDSVGADAEWIAIRCHVSGFDGAASSSVTSFARIRKTGGISPVDNEQTLFSIGCQTDGSGDCYATNVVTGFTGVDSNIMFDMYRSSSMTSDTIECYVVGWGVNQ